MKTRPDYPVRVEATLDPELSRWMWLIKWFLAIPHFIVLAFLFLAFFFTTVIAWFAILFTGRYPRGIFDFNVGVLRWSWRVGYYTFDANGSDRYPPFTLDDVPEYPAHLAIDYPERLSRGLIFVKWFLAIPHWIIVGLLVGGSTVAWKGEDWSFAFPGIIGVLVFVASIMLLFTGGYPPGLFDLIIGFNRWVIRVGAYVSLMRDEYPPFRLDVGGSETGPPLSAPPPTSPFEAAAADPAIGASAVEQPWVAPTYQRAWSTGTAIAVIAGALMSFVGFGLVAGGGVALWFDRNGRDARGFINTPAADLRTDQYAVVSDNIMLRGAKGPSWAFPSAIFDRAQVKAHAVEGGEIFVGVARTPDVKDYLRGVGYATAHDIPKGDLDIRSGGVPESPPGEQSFWVAESEGKGTQTVTWDVDNGAWTIVLMNPDGSGGLHTKASIGATLPALTWLAALLLGFGAVILIIGIALISGGVYRHSHRQ